MSVIVTHKGTTRMIKDEQRVKGTKCIQCNQEMDALAYTLGEKTCFSCLEGNHRESA